MRYAVITSPDHHYLLEHVHSCYHFVLSQDLHRSTEHRETYLSLSRKGCYIIVDNGAAEPEQERISFPDVVDVADKIHADEIALPDRLKDPEWTVYHTIKEAFRVPPRNRMVIPQGENPEEWLECLSQINESIDFRTIGIPKHTERFAHGRRGLITMLINRNYVNTHDIHLLGVWRNTEYEIRVARSTFPNIRGIDTAAPVAYAQHGHSLMYPTKFSYDSVHPVDLHVFMENVDQLRRWCTL